LNTKLANWILPILVLFLLTACQSTTTISATNKNFSKIIHTSTDDLLINDSLIEIKNNIDKNLSLAKALAIEIDYSKFSDTNLIEYFLLRSLIDFKEHKYEIALTWLNKPIFNKIHNANSIQQMHLLKAIIHTNLANYRTAFKYWFTDAVLTNQTINDENLDLLWVTLLNVPETYVAKQLNKTNTHIITSMLELALIFQQNNKYSISAEATINSLHLWKQKWQTFPTIKYLPHDSETLLFSNLDNVAVLLPLTGPLSAAGRDIQEGIVTAHFDSKETSLEDTSINLQFYDTNKQEINEIITQAKRNNCNAIIGPLDKNLLNELSLASLSNITFITLNDFITTKLSKRINKTQKYDSNRIYQFSLSVDDEVLALTKSARSKGHDKAIIVVPDTPQGEKTGDLYKIYWEILGGSIASYIKFPKTADFTKMFENIMHIDDSNLRIDNIKKILETNIDTAISAKANTDVLFLAASPEEARQIKPAMSYQFAKDIPVFAISSIYTDIPSITNDSDLEGISLPVYNWQNRGDISDLQQKVLNFNKKRNQNKNLYALGIDAYNLITKINQLTFFNDNSTKGLTGNLHVNSDFKIIKELQIMRFKNGKLVK
jgi:outer membrane PBP1 activator LpoA protein